MQNFPLAAYAAEYWVGHAHFEDVSSDIRVGMDCLFDKNRPHFAAWIGIFNYDEEDSCVHADHPAQPRAIPLYYAALCGFSDLAEHLLDAHPQDINARGGYHKTPLLAALSKEHLDIALFLLERGADMESRGCRNQTALYIASSRGYAEVVRSLIGRGADLNAKCDDRDDDSYEVQFTPLLVALENRRLETIKVLLEGGADMETRGGRHHRPQTAVYRASSRGDAEVVRLLIDHGADPNAECDEWEDRGFDVKFTPLLVASKRDKLKVATVLLEQGAVPNSQDNFGRSPLHLVSRYPSNDLARLLLNHGANPKASDNWGDTALHGAASEGSIAVATLLLESGANVNAQSTSGETPLHCAAFEGHPEVIQLLLDHGAEVNAQKEYRWTALHLAVYRGRLHVVKVLLEHGVNLHARNQWDQTPFQLASKRNYTQVARLLSQRSGERM